MKVTHTDIDGVLLIEPRVFGDSRGFFLESFQTERYREIGIDAAFVQDNHSRSARGVLRGLHCQLTRPQGKLVRVSRGRVLDVAVDLRVGSPTYKHWIARELDDETHLQMYIPPGLHHGFLVLSEFADFEYKCTDLYFPDDEIAVRWNDPDIGIQWPLNDPIVSVRDEAAPLLADLAPERLPRYTEPGNR